MALVNKIIPFSCIDGPGNRTAIFFQGCNFKCSYCHNPETINKCVNCGKCVAVCPVNALEMKDNKVVWNDKICVSCDACIRECNHLSTPKTKDYSVDELFEEIKQISPFIQGITVSGGEATLNAEFLTELFKRVKNELGLTCFVDTNGSIDLSEYEEFVNLTDKFMIDVKSMNKDEHIKITGLNNDTVIKNLEYLLSLDKVYEIRTVIAPNLDNENTVREASKIIKDKCKYKFNIYRHHGVRKEGLNLHGTESPREEVVNRCRKIYEENIR